MIHYILTTVEGLSRFVQFLPCLKRITGEGTFKLLLERRIAPFGKPNYIHSYKHVRFHNSKVFYQTTLRALGIDVHSSLRRHPSSNGFCENVNKALIQNLRALSLAWKTENWPSILPYCTWLMNSQMSPLKNQTRSEMFHGKPNWKMELVPEPNTSPQTHDWIMQQILAQ